MVPEAPHELNLAQLLRIPFQALVAELHRRLADAGYGDIRPAYTSVFAHLDEHGMRLGELTERAQLTKQYMTYVVDALEALGYVQRERDPADGRGRIVRLTPRGLAASRAGRAIIDNIEREWAARLGEERLARLRSDLTELQAVIVDVPSPEHAG